MTTVNRQTITGISVEDPDDTCAVAVDCEHAARACLAEADALPDGTPEQVGVLLRGLLATQLGMIEMMILVTQKLDAWPQTHGDWHAENPGRTCMDGDRCEYSDNWRPTTRRDHP